MVIIIIIIIIKALSARGSCSKCGRYTGVVSSKYATRMWQCMLLANAHYAY